jgi:uncharacterized RDD family membrane protein YckC
MAGYPTRPTRDDTSVIGARIGAQIIDNIIMAIIFGVIFFVMGGIGSVVGGGIGNAISTIGLLLGLVGTLLYWFLLEGLWDGYTVGKKLFGIKVVEEDGHECSLGSAFVRNLLEIIDGLFYYLIGFIVMAISDKRQRIGDRLAGTTVVRETPRDIDQSEDASADRTTAP